MAFNAGGSNVAGVQQAEVGNLTADLVTTSITADNNYTITTLTVPTGKKCSIKGIGAIKSTGTYDVGASTIKVTANSQSVNLSGTSSGNWSWMPDIPLILSTGQTIQCYVPVTGYSVTGNLLIKILYVESDV